MTAALPAGPLGFALEGEAIRRATGVIEREHVRIATALRRALPFLAKREVPLRLAWAHARPVADILSDLARPFHVAHFVVEPGSAPGSLVLDAGAVSLLLDGVLGGDGRALPTLNTSGLTTPQTALVSRTLEGVVRALSEVLAARVGVRIEPVPARTDDQPGEGTPIAGAFSLGSDENPATVILVLPKDALLTREAPVTAPRAALDPRIAQALDDVDLELVVELARVPMKLGDVLGLRVGDTIPVDVPVGSSVSIRADDRTLLRGRPTTAGGRIAVRIESAARSLNMPTFHDASDPAGRLRESRDPGGGHPA